ncbi:phosphocarrier protein Hpr [Thermosulfidibacter takaii ABI70S6]|uniref:Phosphocarrier protein Hpr n=1 Tax=Thermosulfidibacter takaii (strain DSM 17441 / JCM 13301 / NBRC 103674 / ABI70S6) TaxID=1298851 RepID=A0A0S3QSE0_THET7|nr:HPr family phosphocarrier protein [Thermosulfidibacter takaii]BAT71256.1 phosphocarrier protein Hpr [Thermosulfidibacter takaii ABI70S6]
MKKERIVVSNKYGIHARVAAAIVKEASKYKSDIYIEKEDDGMKANCKSILGLLALGASKGTVLTLEVNGEDEQDAVEAMKNLFEKGIPKDE